MKIYFETDAQHRVFPCCDYIEEIEPEESWHIGVIEAPAYEAHGIPRWKYEDGACVLRTADEIRADIEDLPLPDPTETDQLRADVDFLTMENEALEDSMAQAQADIDYCLMLLEEE